MTFEVKGLGMEATLEIIKKKIIDGSFSGNLVDVYQPENNVLVGIFEKYYYRASNMVAATVVLSQSDYGTKVYVKSAGSASGLMNIDWGAADSFEASIRKSLKEYITD